MTTFAIATLGCKVNTYESQGYESALLKKGYTEVPFKEKADIYIINTCAVTNTAGSKSRQRIHQAIALNPDALIVVVGCYVQTAKEQVEQMEHVDILVGSEGKQQLPQMIEEALLDHRPRKHITPSRLPRVFETLPVQRFEHQTRAFLKIQDGCNQFCSYCIIPYARGEERSLAEEEVLRAAKTLVENGHLEIVLSGIHTGRYGKGVNSDLTTLLKRLCEEVDGLRRIRISSIEMNEVSDELLALMQREKKIARHLHIPIQSACDEILKRMNRPYRVEWFKERLQHIRTLMPEISVSSDVIVGFPQESEEHFAQTLANLEEMQLSFLHIFPYSKRDHTAAAEMSGHLENKVKKERAARLAKLSKALYTDYKKRFIGKDVSVLFEKESTGLLFGHTSEYLEVYCSAPSSLLHRLAKVRIVSYDEAADRLLADIKEEI